MHISKCGLKVKQKHIFCFIFKPIFFCFSLFQNYRPFTERFQFNILRGKETNDRNFSPLQKTDFCFIVAIIHRGLYITVFWVGRYLPSYQILINYSTWNITYRNVVGNVMGNERCEIFLLFCLVPFLYQNKKNYQAIKKPTKIN